MDNKQDTEISNKYKHKKSKLHLFDLTLTDLTG